MLKEPFINLQLIKTYLFISTENAMARSLNFDDAFDTFADQKAQKIDFY